MLTLNDILSNSMVDEFYGRLTARSQEMEDRYNTYIASRRIEHGDNPPCEFCDKAQHKIVDERDSLIVIKNNFPYEVFDGRSVKEHYMIIPLRHVASFKDFTEQEREDYWHLQSKYHIDGYSSMTRSAIDTKRSVPTHLHTHLFFYFTD